LRREHNIGLCTDRVRTTLLNAYGLPDSEHFPNKQRFLPQVLSMGWVGLVSRIGYEEYSAQNEEGLAIRFSVLMGGHAIVQ
jgi:hypothetical protein